MATATIVGPGSKTLDFPIIFYSTAYCTFSVYMKPVLYYVVYRDCRYQYTKIYGLCYQDFFKGGIL